jgi:hypothetical protein
LILAGVCLLAITPFFWRGNPSGHDFEFHMFSWMEVLGQWKHGIVYPRWAALSYWGYGEPRFLFYPPASWTLGAALGAVLPWKAVPGAYCWLAFVLAGAAMYRLAREWLSARDALFAAAFYAVNPYHLLIAYWRSSFAELLAAALLPILLLSVLRLNRPGAGPILRLSLVLAAAWLTNIPAAVMIHYSAAGLVLFLAVCGALAERPSTVEPGVRIRNLQLSNSEVWRLLSLAALAVLLGAGLASFYLVPAFYEQGWVNLSQVLSPGVRPQDNFLFTMLADPDHNRFNLLVSSIAVAEIFVLAFAIWFARKKNRLANGDQLPRIVLSIWGAASAVVMLSVSNFFWQHLPKFRFVQLPFRWLLCMNVALAVLLAVAMKRWFSRLAVCVFLLAVIFVAGYRFQPPWWDTFADIREMSNAIADGSGYEGTDEYVPAGGDAYELNKSLPRVSDGAGAPVHTEVLAWGVPEKHFKVSVDAPQDLTVRLFNYPAWQVVVNGQATQSRTSGGTGLIVIPVAAGEDEVYIYFRRTSDRLIGDVVSMISLIVLVAVWLRARLIERRMHSAGTRITEITAA